MNTYSRLAAAAVAVVTVAAGGCAGGQAVTPSPSALPSATGRPTLSPTSPPPLTQTFTSALHGISMSYPQGWTAQAATEPWTDNAFPLAFPVPQVDWLYDPTRKADLFLAIASQPIGDSAPEEWIADQMASEEGCPATEPITVDGANGVIGSECNVAVVTTAGRGYWIQLYTSDDEAWLSSTFDRAWFKEVLATVQLHPEDAVA